jgi:hypothetical protein
LRNLCSGQQARYEEVQVFFVGVDAHKNTSQITVMDDSGKVFDTAAGAEQSGRIPASFGVD